MEKKGHLVVCERLAIDSVCDVRELVKHGQLQRSVPLQLWIVLIGLKVDCPIVDNDIVSLHVHP